jgi:hypothetical protein
VGPRKGQAAGSSALLHVCCSLPMLGWGGVEGSSPARAGSSCGAWLCGARRLAGHGTSPTCPCLQVFLSWANCPLLRSRLPLAFKLWYSYASWCYLCNAVIVPAWVAVPLVSVAFNIHPVLLDRRFALLATLHYGTMLALQSYSRSMRELKSIWVSQVTGNSGSCGMQHAKTRPSIKHLLLPPTGQQYNSVGHLHQGHRQHAACQLGPEAASQLQGDAQGPSQQRQHEAACKGAANCRAGPAGMVTCSQQGHVQAPRRVRASSVCHSRSTRSWRRPGTPCTA